MANFNRVILIGNLCKQPELRYTSKGTAVLSFTLAVNRKYKAGEEMKQDTAFVPVVVWSRTAEIINQYCDKGSPLMVEGRINTRSYEKNSQKIYIVEIIAENIQLMGAKKETKLEVYPEDKPLEPTIEDTWLEENEG